MTAPKEQDNYWVEFWKEYTKKNTQKDEQSQVLRTCNKTPIDRNSWKNTIKEVFAYLNLNSEDIVLDLFGGNGIFAKELSKKCKSVTIIDVSKELLNNINTTEYCSIIPIQNDVRNISLPANSYTKVLIYAGIQYLSKKETVELISKVFDSLKKEGVCFIGDIPDEKKMWKFFNNKERESICFQSIIENKPIIGTWFNIEWLEKLASFIGFSEANPKPQKEEMIYSHFRFDLLLKK